MCRGVEFTPDMAVCSMAKVLENFVLMSLQKAPVEIQFSSVSIDLLKTELLGAAAFVHCIGFLLQLTAGWCMGWG